LVAKHLVQYEGDVGGEPRYGMLETIREFGRDQLAASGRAEGIRQRHAEWALTLAERVGSKVQGPDGARQLEILERDHATFRAALVWLAEQKHGSLLARLAGALWPFWENHAHYGEGRRWLEAALALAEEASQRERLNLLAGAGTLAWRQADFAQATRFHAQALALARALGDREAEAFALNNLGAQALGRGDFEEARDQYEACIVIAREEDIVHLVAFALHNLTQIQRMRHESAAAMHGMEEVLALSRAHGMRFMEPSVLIGLGLTATDLGDVARAAALFHEGLSLAVAMGNLGNLIDGLESVARLAALTGQETEAARMFGAGEALREEVVFPPSPADLVYFEPALRGLRDALGEEGFATARAEGRTWSRDEAITAALAFRADVSPRATAAAERVSPHGLTERELEVLRLLAAGRSNREIGDALFISPATAARHVANIYVKLDVESRAEATAFAHRHKLIPPSSDAPQGGRHSPR
jgi:non-specific serine/threonine protein kinase